jgi:hypothetical protein
LKLSTNFVCLVVIKKKTADAFLSIKKRMGKIFYMDIEAREKSGGGRMESLKLSPLRVE